MPIVYLSFDRSDESYAKTVSEALESEFGIECCFSTALRGGGEGQHPDIDYIKASDAVIALVSERYGQNQYCVREFMEADALGKCISAMAQESIDLSRAPTAIARKQMLLYGSESFAYLARLVREIADQAKKKPVEDQFNYYRYTRSNAAKQKTLFISHLSDDKVKIAPIIRALIDMGFCIWVDRPSELGFSREFIDHFKIERIVHGQGWREAIQKSVEDADFVLAFWSQTSAARQSEQFHYEIYLALIQQKLRQVTVSPVDQSNVPWPYSFEQIIDLSRFSPLHRSEELGLLSKDLLGGNSLRGKRRRWYVVWPWN